MGAAVEAAGTSGFFGTTEESIDAETVRAVVRALGHRDEPDPGVRADQIGGSPLAGATGGTWRMHGTVQGTPWSAVLKRIVRSNGDGRSPDWPATRARNHPMYWRREAEFYASGVADSMTGSLRAPACLLTRRPGATVSEIWLEDLRDVHEGSSWTVHDFGTASRHLGQFQAEYLPTGRRELPDDPWLSRGWLRWYVKRRPRVPPRPTDERVLDNPLVRTLLAVQDTREDFVPLWHDRFRLLALLDTLPKTLVHHDFWPPNLYLGEDARTTYAIDWAYVGIGTVCEDIANLVPDSLLDGYAHPGAARELDETVFDGYVAGLRDGGSDIPTDVLRFAYAAAASVKYSWTLRYMVDLANGRIPRRSEATPEQLEALFRTRALVLPEITRYYREATRLADRLGLRP